MKNRATKRRYAVLQFLHTKIFWKKLYDEENIFIKILYCILCPIENIVKYNSFMSFSPISDIYTINGHKFSRRFLMSVAEIRKRFSVDPEAVKIKPDSRIKIILETLLEYYQKKGIGHTLLLKNGTRSRRCIIIAHTHAYAKMIRDASKKVKSIPVGLDAIERIRGLNLPIAIDNYSLVHIFAESSLLIRHLEEKITYYQEEIRALQYGYSGFDGLKKYAKYHDGEPTTFDQHKKNRDKGGETG